MRPRGLADFRRTPSTTWPDDLQVHQQNGRVQCVELDVRQPILHLDLPLDVELIVNLAAVHREPGHEPDEYFATNLPGADNVCAWARPW
jgi:nucleoside-diphosphate-sugar epimerase